MSGVDTGIGLVVVIFLVVLALLWFFLPFAIFGTKDLIEQQIKETKETNRLLKQILDLKDQGK